MQFADVTYYLNRIMSFKLFQIQQTAVTVSSLFLLVVVILIFFVFSRILCRIFLRSLLDSMRIEEGTQYNLLRMAHYLVMLTGVLVSFQFVGIDLSGFMVVFGLLSVGIGFGLQNVTSNFISGLILMIERPIKVGDRVTIGNTEGDVLEINMRSTTIRSLNNISIIVPNSEFVSSQVVNWSHRDLKIRMDIDVGVSYASDLEKVLRCLSEVAEECEDVLKTPPSEALLLGFGDSSWNMRLRVWIADPKRHPKVRSDINCSIVRKFRANGVEIPYPQRDLHIRSPLPVPLMSDVVK